MASRRIGIITFLALLLIEASYWKLGMEEHRYILSTALLIILLTNVVWMIAYRRPEWGWGPYALASVIIVAASSLWDVYGNDGKGIVI
ncbi:hypothetical protein HPT25_16590 [Bacillus sp. BRMEA1]|uniref:hypothetical protein n=1 Tax=Neobacillus endophyticus TaxID=2738405 RepID=UPI0015667994|nr:hypothetical protein [Neobacillus endophyticus]NRD78984.1 hypothetical protein [Neobacillus endophyticus]